VDFDRQAIERRDFPVSRRGYDPAAVEAHLRGLAVEFEELQRASGGEASLASTAGTQVQSILEAAERAAAEIESQAVEHARSVREAADQDAARTREQAVERARAHTAAVERATAALLERVESMDGEVGKLLESLRGGAGRLAGDLGALERSMGELYDAAAGRAPAGAGVGQSPPAAARQQAESAGGPTPAPQPEAAAQKQEPAAAAVPAPPAPVAAAAVEATVSGGDLDGARLIALNMALNGQSREDAELYLAAHFQSIDRLKLIDEVYAAIEG
jgi:hypothetical protein